MKSLVITTTLLTIGGRTIRSVVVDFGFFGFKNRTRGEFRHI
jgi:hypothetical protein